MVSKLDILIDIALSVVILFSVLNDNYVKAIFYVLLMGLLKDE